MANAGAEVLAAVTGFLSRRYDDDRRIKLLEGSTGDSAYIFDAAASDGWFDLAVPEQFGGSGLHLADVVGAFRAFGEELLVGPYVEHVVLPALLLTELGVDEAVQQRLALVRAGQSRLAWMDVDPSPQWSLGELDLSGSTLSGHANIVRFAPGCTELLIMGNTLGSAVVALVPATAVGVTVTEVPSSDPGVSIGAVTLDDVQLAPGELLAQGAVAEQLLANARSWARIMLAAELTGMARRSVDHALAYIVQREQFGVSIATFQSVRHIAATATQHVLMLESFADAVADDAASADPDSLAVMAMAFKASASEFARSACEDSIQLHGGIGFTYEYVLHWYYKRILALRAWYGDEVELSIEVGRARLAR